MSNINRVRELAQEIGSVIETEAQTNQKRLFETRQSLIALIDVQENSMMSPQQRTAIKEANDAVKAALQKVESAWGLIPLDAKPSIVAPLALAEAKAA